VNTITRSITTAIQSFKAILEKWPEHIDANYGLSLSLKGAGQKEEAKQAFARTKELVDSEIRAANRRQPESALPDALADDRPTLDDVYSALA